MRDAWLKSLGVGVSLVLALPGVASANHNNPAGTFDNGEADAIHNDATDHPVALTDANFPVPRPAYVESQIGYDPTPRRVGPWDDNFCERRANTQPNAWCNQADVNRKHQGVDITPPTEAVNVHSIKSAWNGTVKVAQCATGTGYYVVIDTVHSTALTLKHKYFHMHPGSMTVSINQSVVRGTTLGKVVKSDSCTTQNTSIHLHFETWRKRSDGSFQVVCPYPTLVNAYHTPCSSCT